jgi:UDP-N-acetylglucosamine--N-acetylmuramyl-(pentapeptide) pyrophosphoryl-undecaprenol N-acetylglucosamine transferase
MRVVFSGGGTGGHIYPALSLAQQCLHESPDAQILYIGSNRGLEKEIVPKAGIFFESIEITGFKRKISWDNVRTILRFLRGVRRSKQLLMQFKPDIVVGTGGYVCGPVLYAAVKLGIPTLVHEQNAIPGLTNRFLSRYVDVIAVSLPGSEKNFSGAKRVVYTGNPRATDAAKADKELGFASLGLPSGSRIVVVVGGSGGAKSINQAMVEMSSYVNRLPDVQFIFVTGKLYFDTTKESIQSKLTKVPKNIHILPYIDNMPEVLAASSLIVNRSGASFLAEITALGLPSILIPSPNVTNNHQEANARMLVDEGAAELILEKDLNAESLFGSIEQIMKDSIRSEHMALQSRRMGQPNSAQLVLNEMLQLCTVHV